MPVPVPSSCTAGTLRNQGLRLHQRYLAPPGVYIGMEGTTQGGSESGGFHACAEQSLLSIEMSATPQVSKSVQTCSLRRSGTQMTEAEVAH